METKVIKERLCIDAFLSMRILYNEGYREFEVYSSDMSFCKKFTRIIRDQKCMWKRRGKVIYVKY